MCYVYSNCHRMGIFIYYLTNFKNMFIISLGYFILSEQGASHVFAS
jgi:hypothetical protein